MSTENVDELNEDIRERLDNFTTSDFVQHKTDAHGHGGDAHGKGHGPKPHSLASAVASAVINFLLMFGLCCAYGMIMFSDDWNAKHRALGVKMNLSTAFLVGLLLSQFSCVPVAIGGPDLNPVVFLGMFVSKMAEIIATELGLEYPGGGNRRLAGSSSADAADVNFCQDGINISKCDDYHEQLRATTIFAVAFSSATLGVLYFFFGRYKLTRFVNFIPTGVMEAFLSCVGYKVFLYAIKFCKYQPKQFIPAACIGVPMYFMKAMHIGNPAMVIPTMLLVPVALFYIGLIFFETDVDTARKNKLYFPEIPNIDFWRIWEDSLFKPDKINFSAWSETFVDLALMYMVCLLDCLLKVSSTGNKLKIKVDADYEVKLYGLSNAITTVCGSSVGYMQLKFNVINSGVLGNLTDRRGGAIYAVLCGVCFFWSIELINYLPRFFLGAMLFFAGSGFVAENLYGSREYLSYKEWIDVFIILSVFVLSGQLLLAVLVGFLITGADFLVKYSKVPCISGRPMRGDELPTRERHTPLLQHNIEYLASKWLLVVKLKGYVFFASAQSMIANTMAEMEAQRDIPTYKRLRFVVFDCEQLDGLDASASKAMKKLIEFAESMEVRILWSSMSPDRSEEWKKRQMLKHDQDWFASLDEALVYVERRILRYRKEKQEAWTALHPAFSVFRNLSRARMCYEPFRHVFTVEAIAYGCPWDYCSRKALKKHRTLLWKPGDLNRELFLVHSGAVGIFQRIPTASGEPWGSPLKIYRHGWFLNREALAKVPTEHFAVALEDGEVLSWGTKQWFNMVHERPLMATAIQNAVMKQEVQDTENVTRRHQDVGSSAPQKYSALQRRLSKMLSSKKDISERCESLGSLLTDSVSILQDQTVLDQKLLAWGEITSHIPEELTRRLAGIHAAQLLDNHGFYEAPPSDPRSLLDNPDVSLPALPRSLREDLTVVFKKFCVDADGSSSIHREDVHEALMYAGIFNVVMTDTVYPESESLGPKMLNLDEFITVGHHAFMARLTTAQRTKIEDVFKDSDKDASGTLDVDELDTILRNAFLPSISIEEVYGISQSWDDDKSGLLEIQEFLAVMSRLIQSSSMNWHLLHGIQQLMGVKECHLQGKLTVDMIMKNSGHTEDEAKEMLWAVDWRHQGRSTNGLELTDVVAAILLDVDVSQGTLHKNRPEAGRARNVRAEQKKRFKVDSSKASPGREKRSGFIDDYIVAASTDAERDVIIEGREKVLPSIEDSRLQLNGPQPVVLWANSTGPSKPHDDAPPPRQSSPSVPSAPKPDVNTRKLSPGILEMVVDMREWTARKLLDGLNSVNEHGSDASSKQAASGTKIQQGLSQTYVGIEVCPDLNGDVKAGSCAVKLYDILEVPDSSGFAKCVSYFMVFVILLSIVNLLVEELVSPSEDEEERSTAENAIWQSTELFFTFVFTIELVLRIGVADARHTRTKLAFMKLPTTVCDIAAVLPWYLEVLVKSDLEFARLLRSFRLIAISRYLRLFRVLKIRTFSKSLGAPGLFGPVAMVLTVIWGIFLKTQVPPSGSNFCLYLG